MTYLEKLFADLDDHMIILIAAINFVTGLLVFVIWRRIDTGNFPIVERRSIADRAIPPEPIRHINIVIPEERDPVATPSLGNGS